MKVSYEGIGQWAATFACTGVHEGGVVKISGGGTAGNCSAGDRFCGVAVSVSHDGGACSVALGGFVIAAYTGTAPAVGWIGLSADGNGGVKSDDAGRSYLVADVNPDDKTITFAL